LRGHHRLEFVIRQRRLAEGREKLVDAFQRHVKVRSEGPAFAIRDLQRSFGRSDTS
jgi:hypothetical protein